MKVAIVGSRDYPYLERVRSEIYSYPLDTTIISGGARGVDTEARNSAVLYGMPYQEFPVDKVGLPPYPEGRLEFAKRAYARNLLIVDAADEVVAFWDGKSRGTKHTMDYAIRVGKPLRVVLP